MRKPLGIATVTVVLLGLALVAWQTWSDAATSGTAGGPGQAPTSGGQAPTVPGQTAEKAIRAHEIATRGPRQPIPFSHRFHVTELQIDCMYCHTGTERSPTGLVPPLEVCMGCHQVAGAGLDPVEEMRQYWARREPIPWEWVHELPDFVQFKHQPHLRTGIACQTCHGPVEEMDRVYRWAPLTMGWCLECHRSEPQEEDVATDHLLVRQEPPPEPPSGRKPLSLYPLVIDQKYAAYRGPTDCLACHY